MIRHPAQTVGLLLLATVAVFPGKDLCGQEPIPFEISRGSYDSFANFYGWVRHVDGQQIGDVQAFTNIGGTKFWERDSGIVLATGAFGLTNYGMQFGNVGLQRRILVGETILGGGLWLDAGNSPFGNTFTQGSLSLELLRDDWSVRANGYLPFGPRVRSVGDLGYASNPDISFQGHNILASDMFMMRLDEVAMKGIDVELARSIGDWSGEAFVGYYNYQGRIGGQTNGIKGGLRGYLTPRLAGNVAISDDPIFGTNVYGGFTFFFGGSGGTAPQTVEDKLTIPVERNEQVVVNNANVAQAVNGSVILTESGQPITVNHVNDSGNAGDGTFENPHGSLNDADNDPDKSNRDIVYVYSGTTFSGQDYILAPNQRFLGEGDNNQHIVGTDLFGPVILPNVNGAADARPVIVAPDGMFALNMANGSEVSNINIVNSGIRGGVFAGGLTGDVNIDRIRIEDGLVGIDVSASSGLVDLIDALIVDAATGYLATSFTGQADVNQVVLLNNDAGIDIIGGSGQFTFTDTTITDPVNTGVRVNGGTADVQFDGTSSLTQNNNSAGIDILGGHAGTFTFSSTTDITATNGTGLQFDDADGTYNFNGDVTLNGGDTGIDIVGDSAGTFTFSSTDITNPTGTAFHVDGGSADVTYSGGSIVQSNNATTVNVQGGHTGTIGFGIDITAMDGDGLQFNNANGIYNFNTMTGATTLSGGDAGIDIIGGAGQFTFTDTTITNPSGPCVRVNGGTADVQFNGTSSLTQNNNAAGIDILSGHAGTFTFSPTTDITATNGTGLQFNNADGTYDFDGNVTLNGGDVGIDIIGDSNGTFTFSSLTSITSPSGTAFNVQDLGAGATVNYNGSIANGGSVFGELVLIDTTAAGSTIHFNSTGMNSIMGNNAGNISIFDADGDVTFTTPVTIIDPANSFLLTGISIFGGNGTVSFTDTNLQLSAPMFTFNAGVELNGQQGTVNFQNLDITSNQPGLVGMSVFNVNNLNVTGSNTVDTTGGDGIVLFDANNTNMTFDSIRVTNSQSGFGGGGRYHARQCRRRDVRRHRHDFRPRRQWRRRHRHRHRWFERHVYVCRHRHRYDDAGRHRGGDSVWESGHRQYQWRKHQQYGFRWSENGKCRRLQLEQHDVHQYGRLYHPRCGQRGQRRGQCRRALQSF